MPRLRRPRPCWPVAPRRCGRLVRTLARLHREFLEQAALPGTEAGRDLHVDHHVEIAAHARPTQMRHAPTAEPDLGTRLGARP